MDNIILYANNTELIYEIIDEYYKKDDFIYIKKTINKNINIIYE